jgi:hypothetical protein
MIESRTKSITLARWQLSKPRRQTRGVTGALPFIMILALLCALSVVWAVKDPLIFAEIFGLM